MNEALITAIIFILIYLAIIFMYEKKAKLIWIGCLLVMVFGILSIKEALFAINLNVLGLYFGMLFIVEAFILSKFPDFLAVTVVNRAKRVSTVFILLALLSGLISIFVENVAVVLIMAPIALAISKRLKISPVAILTAIAVSSNLQGVATLVGDPPSMILAGYTKMTFNDFFFFDGKPSLFFAVQFGALVSLLILEHIFKRLDHQHERFKPSKYRSLFPLIVLVFLIVSLALSSHFDPEFRYLAGLLTIIYGAIAAVWYYFNEKNEFPSMVKKLDWETGLFLAGVFVLVQSLIVSGVVHNIAQFIADISGHQILTASLIIIVTSLILSAFIDNVPFVAAMLPVVHIVAEQGGFSPYLLYFLLLISASVGGNITPIGASANIVAMGIAKSHGYKTKFMDFVKIGFPFTIFAVVASCTMIYVLYN